MIINFFKHDWKNRMVCEISNRFRFFVWLEIKVKKRYSKKNKAIEK
jgi:hypothetical protein